MGFAESKLVRFLTGAGSVHTAPVSLQLFGSEARKKNCISSKKTLKKKMLVN
jgi:hypothetical protein